MISVTGIPVTNVEIWGWPWHGKMEQQDLEGAEFALRRYDDELWPLFSYSADDKIPIWLFYRMLYYSGAVADQGGTTHLVKTHGHTFVPRTTEQLAVDVSRSHEWRGDTMMCGINHAVYMTYLGWYQWIYSKDGKRWLMKIEVDSVPHPLDDPDADLSLTISARPFGEFDVPGEWVECGSVTADSCCTDGFPWFTPGITLDGRAPVLLQSIRSDGGKLILEIRFYALSPARFASGPVGFYELDVANTGVDSWDLDLTLLKIDTDIITKSILSSALTQGVKQVQALVTTPDSTHVLYTPIIQTNGDPTGLWADGLIVQEQRRHCGFVFDSDDVLHELVCVITASHDCSVTDDDPVVTGTALQTLDGSGHVISATNDITVTENFSASVVTTLTVEIERDGTVVSSVSCTLETGKTSSQTYNPVTVAGQDPFPAPDPAEMERTAVLTVGTHTASYTKTNTFDDYLPIPGGDYRKWPDTGLFEGSFCSRSGSTLTPWPSGDRPGGVINQSFESRTYYSNGASIAVTGYAIRLGAARLSNNVFVPVIVAGVPSGSAPNWWAQLSDGWSYENIDGLAATVFGARVGPDINGDAPDDFEPVAGVGPTYIEGGAYDYLHQVVLPYADIF